MPVRTALDEVGEKGEFKRKESTYRNMIEKGGKFEPEKDRYHLYVALACPWACGALATLFVKGLEDCIGYSIVHPTWQKTKEDPEDPHCGWVFRKPGDAPLKNTIGNGNFDCDDALIPDTVNGCASIREIYEKSNDTSGKYTTPVLWDKKEGCIVNNESTEILMMFNSQFQEWAKYPDIDLYPADLADACKAANEWIFFNINSGVYRCGFARAQEPYDEAVNELFAHLDKAEEILSKQRYIAGDKFTWVDLRLFMSLVRFDEVYFVYFKCNKATIRDNYPNLLEYCKDIYQTHRVGKSINMKHIKASYFTAHPTLNTYAVIPAGRTVDFAGPHKRQKFSA
mmetsp:Transcript_47784/g.87865  ORF Transcript_47784/g.87865 Transcript_47784/m.87865 type:complete len:340 (-) Transcript_47784:333-1352(-)